MFNIKLLPILEVYSRKKSIFWEILTNTKMSAGGVTSPTQVYRKTLKTCFPMFILLL